MATDNKINASNTWNFALIDYFHDMSLLRSDSGDGSINFQKASCTLDGCIKVWTSRVDSVVVETGRLLNGLQDELNQANQKGSKRGGNGGDDEDDDGLDEGASGDEDGEGGAGGSKKKKRSKAKDSTLAKDFSQIQLKKLELEFTVDPLFKKTSADFDEGGAGGLLMNHLGVDHRARIVFDAGDVAGVPEDEEAPATVDIHADGDDALDDDATAAATASQTAASCLVPIEMLDVSKLRAKLLSAAGADLDDEEEEGGSSLQAVLSRRTICPTLASFRFSKDDQTLFEQLAGDDEDGDADRTFENDVASVADLDAEGGFVFDDDLPALEDMPDHAEQDFFAGAGVGVGDDVDGGFGGFDDFGGGAADDFDMGGAGSATAARNVVPNRNGPDIFMALGQLRSAGEGADEAGDGMFDYFDQRMMKNWAGPEHWKMRRAVPIASGSSGAQDGGERCSRRIQAA